MIFFLRVLVLLLLFRRHHDLVNRKIISTIPICGLYYTNNTMEYSPCITIVLILCHSFSKKRRPSDGPHLTKSSHISSTHLTFHIFIQVFTRNHIKSLRYYPNQFLSLQHQPKFIFLEKMIFFVPVLVLLLSFRHHHDLVNRKIISSIPICDLTLTENMI